MSGIVLMAYLLGIGFCIVAWGIATHKHPARQDGPEPLPERGSKPCTVSNCRKPATTIIRAGFDNWPVCARCREELVALRGEAS